MKEISKIEDMEAEYGAEVQDLKVFDVVKIPIEENDYSGKKSGFQYVLITDIIQPPDDSDSLGPYTIRGFVFDGTKVDTDEFIRDKKRFERQFDITEDIMLIAQSLIIHVGNPYNDEDPTFDLVTTNQELSYSLKKVK